MNGHTTRVVGPDSETALIRPGRSAPPMTCLTWQIADKAKPEVFSRLGEATIYGWAAFDPHIEVVTDVLPINRMPPKGHLLSWLKDDECEISGANTAFDMGVFCAEYPELLPLVFAAYDDDRITDVQIRQKLLDIAAGCYRGKFGDGGKFIKYNYSLQFISKRVAGFAIKKEGFRLFYGPFRNVPLERWVEHARELQAAGRLWLAGDRTSHPLSSALAKNAADLGDEEMFAKELAGMVAADPIEVITYPLEDASSTLASHLVQEEHAEYLEDQYRQARAAFWLHLTSAYGLRTNPLGVAKLQVATEAKAREMEARLIAAGLVRKNGSRDTKAAKERMLRVCDLEGVKVRLTDSGEPSLDADACKAVEDEVLREYAALTSLKAVLNKDVPALARATVYPIHTRFDLAETGRTTSSNPNVQNWRRLPGIRECFVPRPGNVFIQADYSSLELCTLAQACIDILGGSDLAEAINAGIDPHTDLACQILGIPYEEGVRRRKLDKETDPIAREFDDARQAAKVANFGFPGGLGYDTFILFARKQYNVVLSRDEAIGLKAQWLKRWQEMESYFAHVNSIGDALEQLRSKRIRAGATYTAKCNSYFQGLGSDATKAAGWLIAKAMYLPDAGPARKPSPLYGSRLVNYVHDEFIGETIEARAPEAAEELSRLMVAGAQPWIPDIKLNAEPCLMRVWSKNAKTLRDANGRLVPWAPKEEAKAA